MVFDMTNVQLACQLEPSSWNRMDYCTPVEDAYRQKTENECLRVVPPFNGSGARGSELLYSFL